MQLGQSAGGLQQTGIEAGISQHAELSNKLHINQASGLVLGGTCLMVLCIHFLSHFKQVRSQVLLTSLTAQYFLSNADEPGFQFVTSGNKTSSSQRLELPGPGLFQLVFAKGFDAADQRSGAPIGAQTGINVVQAARRGQDGQKAQHPLSQARKIPFWRQRSRTIGQVISGSKKKD